jgi:ribosomal protein L7Ae-like RNA K-turn-binding protein
LKDKKYLTYLGFALKSGKCTVGSYACESALRLGKIKVLLCSDGASQRTAEKYQRLCAEKGVPFYVVEGEDLRRATGKTDVNLFAVSDQNLAKAMIDNLNLTLGVQEIHE